MITTADLNTVEAGPDGPGGEEAYYLACQRLINSGDIWNQPGSIPHALRRAVITGHCSWARIGHTHPGGGWTPGRHDLLPGSLGTLEYVQRMHGHEWATKIEEQ